MSRVIVLDTGPLGLLPSPKRSAATASCAAWAVGILRAGHRFVVPAIADFELRRELERAGKTQSLVLLNAWNAASPGRYLSVTDSALRLAAKLWAQARNARLGTADPKELDADVLIAAQALDLGISPPGMVVATTNVGRLSRYVPAELWMDVLPS